MVKTAKQTAVAEFATNTEVYPTRDQWLLARRNGIGGSDAPVLMGQSTTKGAADLWLAKVDGTEHGEPTERMKWGIRQEDGIRRGYIEDSGRNVIVPESPYTIIRRASLPWLCYSPDGTQYCDDFEGPGVLQVKNVAEDQRWKWQDGPPDAYIVQVQHEMMVGNWKWATIMALFGGNEGAWWDIEANPTFQESLLEVERDFWGHVERQQCPPIDTHLATALKTLKHLYPESQKSTISLMEAHWPDRLDELAKLDQLAKEYQAEADAIRAEFQQAMRESEAAILQDGRQVTWKTQQRKAYTVEAASFRVFRFPKK